jgi:hypothetical protein
LRSLLLRLFIVMAPGGMPFLAEAQIDIRILAFALATTVICAVIFGLILGLRSVRLSRGSPAAPASTARHAVLRRRAG